MEYKDNLREVELILEKVDKVFKASVNGVYNNEFLNFPEYLSYKEEYSNSLFYLDLEVMHYLANNIALSEANVRDYFNKLFRRGHLHNGFDFGSYAIKSLFTELLLVFDSVDAKDNRYYINSCGAFEDLFLKGKPFNYVKSNLDKIVTNSKYRNEAELLNSLEPHKELLEKYIANSKDPVLEAMVRRCSVITRAMNVEELMAFKKHLSNVLGVKLIEDVPAFAELEELGMGEDLESYMHSFSGPFGGAVYKTCSSLEEVLKGVVTKQVMEELNSKIGKSVIVENIIVSAEYRGKGLMTRIVETLKGLALEQGYESLTLHAFPINTDSYTDRDRYELFLKLVAQYKKLGFEVIYEGKELEVGVPVTVMSMPLLTGLGESSIFS